ncbi:hypothetical protein SELMODRAFT_416183 [Selaginella moellendorffii]|uniref:Dirigent protein n=1 Tax=Selaginella moellendorffii TaxID=88036 RepID=D8RYC3_SELML|nr:hypothetical protein SELMODRAFT_416183 [Selaginella moellendorffii]
MASQAALVLALAVALFSSYVSANLCKSYTIQGSAQFVFGQNLFQVVPTDGVPTTGAMDRDGSVQTFAAPLSGNPGCIYQGVIADTGALEFLFSQIKCGNNRVEFMGDAGGSAPGSSTTYAILGGTGIYVGATGTVTEASLGGMNYQVTANIKVCDR